MKKFLIGVLAFGGVVLVLMIWGVASMFNNVFSTDGTHSTLTKNSILKMEINGVIMDARKFTKQLNKYAAKNDIKAVVIEINSPGGVVGPSQEIYEEIRRVRTEHKKPIIAVTTGLAASGAFYAAVGADKFIVAPGSMVGSIGVIMEFMNLEKLYDWAKVSRFSINTGKYKDSGAEYRTMRDDERAMFQDLINHVWTQFKTAVAEGRNLKMDQVNPLADGRVFTGDQAVELGLADQVGTTRDAYKIAAEAAGLGTDYKIFEPPKRINNLRTWLMEGDDEEDMDVLGKNALQTVLRQSSMAIELSNKPLYLMPGYF